MHLPLFLIDPQALTAGIDEAGRGCLAGPVVAGAVILDPLKAIDGLADSKKLSSSKRTFLAKQIKQESMCWAIGVSWPREIDRLNILQATLLAMRRAAKNLKSFPEVVLIDGNQKIPLDVSQKTIKGGDATEPCISAASILAKTFRDGLMKSLDRKYPGYGLARHKGYGTREHLAAIRLKGPSSIHRMTFRGVKPVVIEKKLCLITG